MRGSVSVIIPVYNAEAFVEQAVCSALDQPETGEVVLIEDGSPDGSLAVCERLAAGDERVRLLRHPGGVNKGAAESRNVGIREACCPVIGFLDADDYLLPGAFGEACRRLCADSEIDGVYGAVGTDFAEAGLREWWAEQGKREVEMVTERVPPEQLFEALVTGRAGYFHTNGVMVRRELFERTGLFEPELRMSQDGAMWLRMAAVGRLVAGSFEPVAMRRLHGENRIYRDEAKQARYKLKVTEQTLAWVVSQGVQRGTWAKLLRKQMVQAVSLDASGSDWRGRARVLGRVLMRYPWAVGVPEFWRQVRKMVGGAVRSLPVVGGVVQSRRG